ncbi:MAG TPA: secondary thiamine-phosphate synthase enzyme YjbQ [Bacteroidales bacterium]|nr:secondary thiamine-phosphate synthase enzyme YjbQ [Bacteroidales bacterium]
MTEIISISTDRRNGLYDITKQVESIVMASGIKNGLVSLFARGATAAIMIQENWDNSVQTDVVNLLNKLIPQGVWEHDHQDNNGDSHLKSGIVGPSESVPLIDGKLALSTWQNIFFCEFDGPRERREIAVTVIMS